MNVENMKNTILLQAVALISYNQTGYRTLDRFVYIYIYIYIYIAKKFIPFEPKNSAEFLTPPEFFRNVLEKNFKREPLTFKFQTI